MTIKQSRYITADTTGKKEMAIRTTELDKVKDDPCVRKSEVQQTVNNSTLPVSSRAVNLAINNIEMPSLDGYATEDYVDQKFDSIDLSSYASTAYVDGELEAVGARVDSADERATEALNNSSEALGSANTALDGANTALSVAQGADGKAQEALDTAQSALDGIPADYVKDVDFDELSDKVDNKRDIDDNIFNGHLQVRTDNEEQGAGVSLQDTDGTVVGQVVATDQGLQLTQYSKDRVEQTFTFPNEGGEVSLANEDDKKFLEYYGVSANSDPEFNAQVFKSIIESYGTVKARGKYVFDFNNIEDITVKGFNKISIFVGEQVFRNFEGIISSDVNIVEGDIVINSDNTYCKGLIKSRSIIEFNFNRLGFKNVFIDTEIPSKQFFGFEYASNYADDVSISGNINHLIVRNCVTKTVRRAEGNPIPMTILGSFGSLRDRKEWHHINITKVDVSEFYSVNSDGDIIDGDSDVFRMFSNPFVLNIQDIQAENFSKRLFKSQNKGSVNIVNVHIKLDHRFENNVNNIASFDMQDTFYGNTSLNIENVIINNSNTNVIFNSVSKDHIINVNGIQHEGEGGLIIYAYPDIKSSINLNNVYSNNFSVNAGNSELVINNSKIVTAMLKSMKTTISNSSISILHGYGTSSYPITNLIANQTNFYRDPSIRIAEVLSLTECNVVTSQKDTVDSRRPFRSIKNSYINRLVFESNIENSTIFDKADEDVKLVFRDCAVGNSVLAYLNSGNNVVIIDNCTSTKVTGSSANNLVKISAYE